MKVLMAALLMVFYLSSFAQKKEDDQSKRQEELFNYLEHDIDLYRKGSKNIKSAKSYAIASLVILGADVGFYLRFKSLHPDDTPTRVLLGMAMISASATSIISALFGVIEYWIGKRRIKMALKQIQQESGQNYGQLKIKTTSNGVGLTYHF